MPAIVHTLQNADYRTVFPVIRIIGECFPLFLCVIRFRNQHVICFEDFCYLHRSFSVDTQIKNPLHHSGGFFVHNPLFLVSRAYDIAVGRLCQVFPCHALRPFDCPYLFACVLCVKIVKQITERGKIVIPLCAVHTVIDCDIAHVTLHEKDFRIVANFQIIAP